MTSVKLVETETKLFVRDPIWLFFGLVFPGLLLLLLGLFFPGFDEPSPDLDGRTYLEVYAPIVLVLGLATLGLVTLPPILGTYRQFGILRRLRTTPVHPARLLGAQLVVHLGVAILAALVAIAVASIVFDVALPQSPLWFIIAYILAAASVFSLGLLVGAIAPTTNTALAIGMAIYFPMLFFAGLWIPRSVMPDGLRTMSDLTPMGAAVQALEDAWFGSIPSVANLAVMAAWAVAIGAIAVWQFRWE